MPTRYVCVSIDCRNEVEIQTPIAHKNGMCFERTCPECGSEMKKVYEAPILTRLSKSEAVERFGGFGEVTNIAKKAAG